MHEKTVLAFDCSFSVYARPSTRARARVCVSRMCERDKKADNARSLRLKLGMRTKTETEKNLKVEGFVSGGQLNYYVVWVMLFYGFVCYFFFSLLRFLLIL